MCQLSNNFITDLLKGGLRRSEYKHHLIKIVFRNTLEIDSLLSVKINGIL